ncbi:MAG: type II toxin-antitoxin system CcdA family antitoxin [SAR324 cluster bacterium]|nr:type II toxin-antitoxin system CcdA family antitoxin [SAR324 cluster bacterium]
MQTIFDKAAPKKPTNLSVNSDLLKKAKELKINLSATLENALTQIVKEKQENEWKKFNKGAIQEYNKQVEKQGVFSKELRSF